MKKLFLPTRLLTLIAIVTLIIIGCKKESSDTLSSQEEESAATYTTESETDAQFAFDDVFDNVMGVSSDIGIGGVGIFGRTTSSLTGRTDSTPVCVNVTITPLQREIFPKTVVMDFGTGCYSHGHLRSGKITTVYTGRLTTPGSSATTTFQNFIIDDIAVEGTHKIANTTATGSNQRQFTIAVTDAKLTKPNGDYEVWNTTRTITQIEGNGTVLPSDDIFRITGKGQGKVKRENLIISWHSEITEPLVKKFTCRWIAKGIVKTVREGLPANTPWVAALDYGNGDCDNKATLTVNGNVRQITLR